MIRKNLHKKFRTSHFSVEMFPWNHRWNKDKDL